MKELWGYTVLYMVGTFVLFYAGPSALLLSVLIIFLFVTSCGVAMELRERYKNDLVDPPSIYVRSAQGDRFSSSYLFHPRIKDAYYKKAMAMIGIYTLLMMLLSEFFPDLLNVVVIANSAFMECAAFLFPTLDAHYTIAVAKDPDWAKALKQIYAVFFFFSILAGFCFSPVLLQMGNVAAHGLTKEKKWFNGYIRTPLIALVFSITAVLFYYTVFSIDPSSVTKAASSRVLHGNRLFFISLFTLLTMPLVVAIALFCWCTSFRSFFVKVSNHKGIDTV